MDAEVQLYIDQLDDIRGKVKETIQGMSAEELNWKPPIAESNSPYVLAAHLPGSETQWIHQFVGGMDVSRDRDAEFRASGDSAAPLIERLDQVGNTSREVLGRLTSDDLGQRRTRPIPAGSTDQVTVRYGILNFIVHMSEHLGHLGLPRQLYAGRKRE